LVKNKSSSDIVVSSLVIVVILKDFKLSSLANEGEQKNNKRGEKYNSQIIFD
jgi:hypothetical protein